MKIINLSITLAMTFSLMACQSTEEQTTKAPSHSEKNHEKRVAPPSKKAVLETIYDMTLAQDSISFSVVSNGCTKAKDFALDVVSDDANTLQVSLLRLNPDYCRAMPRLISIAKPLPQMAGNIATKVVLKNPYSIKQPGRAPVFK